MSWSWVSKILQKKVLDEIGKQLNLDISKDGKITFRSVKRCQFCRTTIPAEEVFCPKCCRSLT